MVAIEAIPLQIAMCKFTSKILNFQKGISMSRNSLHASQATNNFIITPHTK